MTGRVRVAGGDYGRLMVRGGGMGGKLAGVGLGLIDNGGWGGYNGG